MPHPECIPRPGGLPPHTGGGKNHHPPEPTPPQPQRSLPRTIHLLTLGLLLPLSFAAPSVSAQADLPPRPTDLDFLHDLAAVLTDEQAASLQRLQRATFEQHGVPIVVVSIARMADYSAANGGIEDLARQWFDHWGIGSEQRNNGMLVLLPRAGERTGPRQSPRRPRRVRWQSRRVRWRILRRRRLVRPLVSQSENRRDFQQMQNACKTFTEQELQRIAERIGEIEHDTTAEVVCAVTTESGRYDRAESLWGLLFGLALLIVANDVLLFHPRP